MNNAPAQLPVTDPEALVAVVMRRRELDYVLQVLATRPYLEVSDLIDRIARGAKPVESVK